MRAEPLAGRHAGSLAGAFVVVEWTVEGTAAGAQPQRMAPLHVHHRDDEVWYVLEGTLHFQVGDDEVEAPAGSAVFGPHGVPHTWWNPASEPARYLLVMTPNTFRMIEALHSMAEYDPDAMRAIFREHGCEIVG